MIARLRRCLSEIYWAWQKKKAQHAAMKQAYLEAARNVYGVPLHSQVVDVKVIDEWREMQSAIGFAVDMLRRGDPLNKFEQQSLANRLELAVKGERR